MQILNSKKGTTMPHLVLLAQNNGTYTVMNRTYNADFQVEFQTEEQALKFITDFMVQFFASRVF
jgi:hypothetical protein